MNPEFGSNLGILWEQDPRLIGIRMARYKFVAKMLARMNRVLEVGAGDGTLARIVQQAVGHVDCIDKDPQAPHIIRADFTTSSVFCCWPGFLPGVSPRRYDAIYALDVLEHVAPADEDAFMRNICESLEPFGTCIIGMPSAESQVHASAISKAGHVNCKTQDELRRLMRRYFQCVYLFGMNDEVVHTGFGPMCHYRLAVANTKVTP